MTWLLEPVGTGADAYPIRLANAYCVAQATSDADYFKILNERGINLPDGSPIHWVMRQRTPETGFKPERVRGPSLFRATLDASQQSQTKHYFLGSSSETLQALLDQVSVKFPQAKVAGSFSPPYGPIDPDKVAEWAKQVQMTKATIVWVGLGSPKQDFVTKILSETLSLHCVGVGAAFDFMAGNKPASTNLDAGEWVRMAIPRDDGAAETLEAIFGRQYRFHVECRSRNKGQDQEVDLLIKPHETAFAPRPGARSKHNQNATARRPSVPDGNISS